MGSKELDSAKVWRGGVTARRLSLETKAVRVNSEDGMLCFSFDMDSKGGGTTRVQTEFGPGGFEAILEAMAGADRQQAMVAMLAELARQIAQQPDHDAGLVAEGRDSVKQLAKEKYQAAPSGSDDAEKFIWQSVSKLTKELKEAEDAENTTSNSEAAGQQPQIH